MRDFVVAADLGSSWIKASVLRSDGTPLSFAREKVPSIDWETGGFDGNAYARAAIRAMRTAVTSCVGVDRVEGIILASQRATVLAVDGEGEPVTPAFSWQVPAGNSGMNRVLEAFGADRFQSITGLLTAPIFPVFRLAELTSVLSHAVRGGALIVSLPDFLLHRLGASDLFTDASLASATGLFDLERWDWSEDLLLLANVPRSQLPAVVHAGSVAGKLNSTHASLLSLPEGTPLYVGGGDQQCAVLGAGVLAPGEALVSLGTAAAVLVPMDRFERTNPGLILSAHILPEQWVVEGFVGSFGSVLEQSAQFLHFDSVAAMVAAAHDVELGMDAPVFIPPRSEACRTNFQSSWHCLENTALWNIKREILAATVLEGLALDLAETIQAVDANLSAQKLRTAEGSAQGTRLLREIASAAKRPVSHCVSIEAALFGVACLALSDAGRSPVTISARAASREQTFHGYEDRPSRKQRAQRFATLKPRSRTE